VVLRRLNGIRILLAEDNPINQQIAVELLESAGAAVEVAENGAEAVRKLASAAPPGFDIVLMDLQMPEMDGYQATAKIRSDPRFEKLPIIAMTAHATMEERQRCLEAGMNDHVSKPIVPDILYAPWSAGRSRPKAATTVAAESKPDAAAPAGIPVIEGIDAADGLARVAGNAPLYRRLLERFAVEEGAAGDAIAGALDRGDRGGAERVAHTVKGVAGNLAMRRLREAAATLERAIREGGERLRRRWRNSSRSSVGRSMRSGRRSRGPRRSRPGRRRPLPTTPRPPGWRSRDFAICSRRVTGRPPRPSPGCPEFSRAPSTVRVLDALARAIDDFDFEGALAKLDAIARDCSIEATA
jgi:CheY-like chemotaxis protein